MDDDKIIGLCSPVGILTAIWTMAFLFHLGPPVESTDSPWWAFPYYATAFGIGLAGGIVVWGIACYGVERLSEGKDGGR